MAYKLTSFGIASSASKLCLTPKLCYFSEIKTLPKKGVRLGDYKIRLNTCFCFTLCTLVRVASEYPHLQDNLRISFDNSNIHLA